MSAAIRKSRGDLEGWPAKFRTARILRDGSIEGVTLADKESLCQTGPLSKANGRRKAARTYDLR